MSQQTLANLAQGIGSASSLELLWTLVAAIGVALYAYGWWDVREDRKALDAEGRDSDLGDLVDSDLETAVIGFFIILIFFLAGLWSCFVPSIPNRESPDLAPQIVLFRIVIPIAFVISEWLLVIKQLLLLRRRHRQFLNRHRWSRPGRHR